MTRKEDIGSPIKGAGALLEMLDCIGGLALNGEPISDHEVAKILTTNELELRKLLRFAMVAFLDILA